MSRCRVDDCMVFAALSPAWSRRLLGIDVLRPRNESLTGIITSSGGNPEIHRMRVGCSARGRVRTTGGGSQYELLPVVRNTNYSRWFAIVREDQHHITAHRALNPWYPLWLLQLRGLCKCITATLSATYLYTMLCFPPPAPTTRHPSGSASCP